jgi:cysteine desulfurase
VSLPFGIDSEASCPANICVCGRSCPLQPDIRKIALEAVRRPALIAAEPVPRPAHPPDRRSRRRARTVAAAARRTIETMPIYLDHAATTPLRREALEAMLPYLTADFGNASSPHSFGRQARAGMDEAHERVAKAIGATPREIVFTSGGSESNNLALKGAAWAGKARGHRIITSAVEHHSVGHTLRYLEKFGFEIVELPVDRYGRVDPDQVEAAITPKTILVSIMLANNEVGTIQPMAEIAACVHSHKGILLHTDAAQAAAHLTLDVAALDVDLLSLAGHKFEGPKGVGALYVRHGTNILAQQQGGSQERYRRAGTEDVASAIGMAAALELAVAERAVEGPAIAARREALAGRLRSIEGVTETGHQTERLPGLASFVVDGVVGASLVMALDLDGLACSTGSACTSGSTELSHVLLAMGYPEEEARGALRLSLGRTTTDAEIDQAGRLVARAIETQRAAEVVLAANRTVVTISSGNGWDPAAHEEAREAAREASHDAASEAVAE